MLKEEFILQTNKDNHTRKLFNRVSICSIKHHDCLDLKLVFNFRFYTGDCFHDIITIIMFFHNQLERIMVLIT